MEATSQAVRVESVRPPIAAERVAKWAAAGAALILLFVAAQLPLWQATLQAPQYPGGLDMIAYGDHVAGDVNEINILNHYIGMKALKWSDIPERALWIPGLMAAVIAIAIATIAKNRVARRLMVIGLWLFPIGVLADVQFRLYQYGHDLNEGAALRVPEFTPWVVGPTKIWNFSTVARPGLGVALLFIIAAVITFAPGIVRKREEA